MALFASGSGSSAMGRLNDSEALQLEQKLARSGPQAETTRNMVRLPEEPIMEGHS